VLKIKDNSNTQVRDPQIVQHQSTFVISNSVDRLGIHDDGIKRDQVRNKKPDVLSFVEDVEDRLLPKRNASQTKLDRKRIFVWLLKQSVIEPVKDVNRTPHNSENLFFSQ
jgi:hypothetical protein